MNETTFENARVGDRLWSSEYGWGKVIEILDISHLKVYFDECTSLNQDSAFYSVLGIRNAGNYRTLFWDEVKFEAPPRPKRMVKKVVEGWVNIKNSMQGGCWPYAIQCSIYKDSAEALKNRTSGVEYFGKPLFIHHEYEVEE